MEYICLCMCDRRMWWGDLWGVLVVVIHTSLFLQNFQLVSGKTSELKKSKKRKESPWNMVQEINPKTVPVWNVIRPGKCRNSLWWFSCKSFLTCEAAYILCKCTDVHTGFRQQPPAYCLLSVYHCVQTNNVGRPIPVICAITTSRAGEIGHLSCEDITSQLTHGCSCLHLFGTSW